MYNKIYNPQSNEIFDILSNKGKSLLKKYLNVLKAELGGYANTEDIVSLDIYHNNDMNTLLGKINFYTLEEKQNWLDSQNNHMYFYTDSANHSVNDSVCTKCKFPNCVCTNTRPSTPEEKIDIEIYKDRELVGTGQIYGSNSYNEWKSHMDYPGEYIII